MEWDWVMLDWMVSDGMGWDRVRWNRMEWDGIRTAWGTISPNIVMENVDIKNPVAPDVMSAIRIESCDEKF